MPRPKRRRRVCSLPNINQYGPRIENDIELDNVIMDVEEYETIRLIDLEKMTQEECAKQMNVARTTIQKIYFDARGKIADSLVNGKNLVIKGGDYKIHNHEELGRCESGCGNGQGPNRGQGRGLGRGGQGRLRKEEEK